MNDAALHREEAARHRRRSRVGLAALIALILGGAALFIAGLAGPRPRKEIMVPGMVLAGCGAIAGVVAGASQEKARRCGVASALAERGMEVDPVPAKDRREASFVPFGGLRALRHGAKGVRLGARGEVEGRRVFLIEHRYTVHAGNSHQTIRHTAAAIPCPPEWPTLNLRPQNFVTGWWANLRGHDMRLENDAFNERWIVRTENEDFALLVLSPEVQAFLCEGPAGEAWQIGKGWICWYRQKAIKMDHAHVPIERLTGLARLFPPELQHWQG